VKEKLDAKMTKRFCNIAKAHDENHGLNRLGERWRVAERERQLAHSRGMGE